MKLLKRYSIVLGLAILGAVVIITYQNYMAKNTDQSVYRYTQPLIDKKLDGIVLSKSIVEVSDRLQSSNAMIYSLRIDYMDIITKEQSNFIMNFRYQNVVDPSDTIIKYEGEEMLHLHKKSGLMGAFQIVA